jgi:NTP pyrophosphatase (non-canonical NTP hydrolase)
MKKEDVLKIIQFYGVMPQLKYFQSEVFELNEAIFEYENAIEGMYSDIDEEVPYYEEKYKKHIAEEIADVMVMLEQFKLYYDISSEEITEIFWSKVNRQLDRIAKEG